MRQASPAGIKMPAEAVDVESTDCATILERVTFWRAARASQYNAHESGMRGFGRATVGIAVDARGTRSRRWREDVTD